MLYRRFNFFSGAAGLPCLFFAMPVHLTLKMRLAKMNFEIDPVSSIRVSHTV